MYFFLDADKSISKLKKKYNKKLKNLCRKLHWEGAREKAESFPVCTEEKTT